MRAMNYGKVEEPSSSRSRYPSTARNAAISAILTVTSSKSDRAPTLLMVNVRPGRDADLDACRTLLRASLLARTIQHRSAAVSREAEFARYGVWLEHILGRRGRRDGLETVGPVCIAR